MVQLTRIYTRTGDRGRTRLADMSETSKTDARVACVGDVDEANSVLGVALAIPALPQRLRIILAHVQNELFDLGADLSTPLATAPSIEPLRIIEPSIARLETWCDELNQSLEPLSSFILPGGSPAAAHLHVARTVVRRAERTGWQAVAENGTQAPGGISLLALRYLNRLSDLLFLMARTASGELGDVLWIPGTDRDPLSDTAGPEGTPPAN